MLALTGSGMFSVLPCALYLSARVCIRLNQKQCVSEQTKLDSPESKQNVAKAHKLAHLSNTVSIAIQSAGGIISLATLPFTPFQILTTVFTLERICCLFYLCKSLSKL